MASSAEVFSKQLALTDKGLEVMLLQEELKRLNFWELNRPDIMEKSRNMLLKNSSKRLGLLRAKRMMAPE